MIFMTYKFKLTAHFSFEPLKKPLYKIAGPTEF